MTSKRTKIFPKNGRGGLGHVTPIIFSSTVGYPSDSLASCFANGKASKTADYKHLNKNSLKNYEIQSESWHKYCEFLKHCIIFGPCTKIFTGTNIWNCD